jgi:hypothetical protein
MTTHGRQFNGARNKFDLDDRVQVQIVRKRLKVSNKQPALLVKTAGNSIAAVSREANFKRRFSLPERQLLPAEVTVSSVKELEIAAVRHHNLCGVTPTLCCVTIAIKAREDWRV